MTDRYCPLVGCHASVAHLSDNDAESRNECLTHSWHAVPNADESAAGHEDKFHWETGQHEDKFLLTDRLSCLTITTYFMK